MAERLEIVFTGDGESTSPRERPSSSAQTLERAPGPADRVTGPKKSDATTGRDIENAVQKVANVLGVGGLTGTAIQLRRAFSDLFESVTASAKAVEKNRRADAGGGSPSAEIKGPPKSSEIPRPGDVAAPPVTAKPPGPSIPRVGAFERQAAKGDIAGPPVTQAVRGPVPNVGWFERMTAAKGGAEAPPVVGSAIPGPTVAPPVAGPSVGAGAAASGLSRLAAMAGPAALAVAGITAAIGAGVIIIKKTFAAIDAEASRLSGYSGALAGAEARAQVRQQFADIRRAQTIGPQLARARDFTSAMETKLTDLKTSIIKFGLDTADAIHSLPKTFADGLQGAADDLKIAAKEMSGDKEGAKKMAEELARIRQLQEKQARDKADEKDLSNYGDEIMDAFLGNFTGGMSSRDRRKAARTAARRA